MRQNVICHKRRGGYLRNMILAGLLSGTTVPLLAADDLGVTMRMVTDDALTDAVTREIELPRPEPSARENGTAPANPGRQGEGNPFMEGGPPGLDRDRPGFSPSDARSDASEKARDRRPDVDRGVRPERPSAPARPDNPGRPENPGRPDRPGNGNRP